MSEVVRTLVRAEVVYNGLGTPRTDAAVVVERAGASPKGGAPKHASSRHRARIVAIGDAADLMRAYPEAAVLDAGFAISPPPVNAHTHFDLSSMGWSERSYVAFVREVIAHGATGERDVAATRSGVEASLAIGVNVVGDIVTTAEGMEFLLGHERLTGVAYWEVVAPDPGDADRVFARTVEDLRRFRSLERAGGVRVGLSPHAAHTVSGPLLQRLADLCRANGVPMQIHVAESSAERELFELGTGPLADMMRGLGVGAEPPGVSPVRYLADLGVLAARPTLVHMVEVDEADVRLVQHAGCSVVHCPRSNAALGSGRFRWELFAKHAVSVGFGTDSLGSSPSLSVLDEVAAARDLHGERASPVALVWAAVKGGYRALGAPPPVVRRGAPAGALAAWSGSRAVGLDVYTAQHTASVDLA